jgi:transcriptional regulator with XRE-family HTH domain
MPKRQSSPGERLRATRLALGLTLRDVHTASIKLARRLRNRRFILPASRLHDFEVKNTIPSLHRLYTLAYVCGCEVIELLGWYGVPRR